MNRLNPLSKNYRAVQYKDSVFRYLALRSGEHFKIIQGRISLTPMPSRLPHDFRDVREWRVGQIPLTEIGSTVREVIARFLKDGPIETNQGVLLFPPPNQISITPHSREFYEMEFSQESAICRLVIPSDHAEHDINTEKLDWSVRSSDIPYDNFRELLAEFGMIDVLSGISRIEIEAHRVIQINLDSRVEGEIASISVLLHPALEPNKCRVGYKIHSDGDLKRGTLNGKELSWDTHKLPSGFSVYEGKAEIKVPKGSRIQCFGVYSNISQHHLLVWDPSTFFNLRRALWEGVDRSGRLIQEVISTDWQPGARSRDFETAVSALFWLLGFSSNCLALPSMSENPDILAVTPKFRTMVIECTTGMPDENSKLAKLARRVVVIKESLIKSGFQSPEIQPVLVTGLPRPQADPHFESAKKLGIAILTREYLVEALQRALIFQDADLIYDEIKKLTANPA